MFWCLKVKRVGKARVKILALVVVVAFLVLPSLVQAVVYSPGVKVGDWIKYGQITVTWTGNGTEPSFVTGEKNMDWARIDVVNVAGTVVNLNLTAHYINGTETSQSSSEDLNGGAYSGSRFLVAANLRIGEMLSTQQGSPTINQTVTRVYAGTARDVNLLNITSVYRNQDVILTIFYDQSTGVMVETYMKTPDFTGLATPAGTVEISMIATETNIWQPTGPVYITIFAVACAILTVVSFFGLRRINRPK